MDFDPWQIHPGYGLGFITLGAALQDILSIIEQDKSRFTDIHVHFSQSDPLTAPIVVTLPPNGLRLRFDGADQRLRLIEVVDFKKIVLVNNKSMELVKLQEMTSTAAAPHFKRVYQMFGASYPGEYMPPVAGRGMGTYVLSWPGIAFNFPLQHSAYSPEKDHVSLLGSHAASSAAQMAIFEGKTWADARTDLFVREPTGPRSTALATRSGENLPAEIEIALVQANGTIELERRHPTSPFTITLNHTTPQDLITELGAPDATYQPKLQDAAPETAAHKRTGSISRAKSKNRTHPNSQPSSYSSTNTDTFESDFDPYGNEDLEEDPQERSGRDAYWCYFGHGMDILVGPPSDAESGEHANPLITASSDLVVKRVILQGNVPGSAAFNRHRRLRWALNLSNSPDQLLTSESNFETELKPALLEAFPSAAADQQTALGRVINRCWDDPMESSFYLPDQDRDTDGSRGGTDAWLGNVRLFQFPGLMFEVLQNGAVAGLYVTT